MDTITFKLHRETKLPRQVIKDAPSQGAFDDYAESLLESYNIDVSLEDSQTYLKRLGAWEEHELQDLELNKRRLLWIACLDCKEEKTQYWYMGD